MQNSLKQCIKLLSNKNLDGFIVTNPTNIFYLCGFRGISPTEREAILVFNHGATLITARLYQKEATNLRSKELKIIIADERNKILEHIKILLKNKKKVGFEEEDSKYSEFKQFKKYLTRSLLVPSNNIVEGLRIIKTEEEIKRIEKAQIITQKAYSAILKTIKIGQTEAEIAQKLETIIKSLGAQGLAFESIIASGPNSALPHYQTGKRKIKKGDVLLFDFGAKYRNYCADFSRTIFIGKTNDQKKNIYEFVRTLQKNAIEQIQTGQKSSEVYSQIIKTLKQKKLEKYFLHSLGHGIGLDVHEAPHLRPAFTKTSVGKPNLPTTNYQLFTNNMVLSIEPGLYFPWGGVRIEDLVVIKNGKAKVLGNSFLYNNIPSFPC